MLTKTSGVEMARSIQIYIPPEDYSWYRGLLDDLANKVIKDEEAGQRGTKLSRMVQAIACAYIVDPVGVLEHMLAIKNSALESPWKKDSDDGA